jgi:hypothetical protein
MLEEQDKSSSDNWIKVSNIYLNLYYTILEISEPAEYRSPRAVSISRPLKSRWHVTTVVKEFGAVAEFI